MKLYVYLPSILMLTGGYYLMNTRYEQAGIFSIGLGIFLLLVIIAVLVLMNLGCPPELPEELERQKPFHKRRFFTLASLVLVVGSLACCSVNQLFMYKPNDMVMVRGTRMQILRPVHLHNGDPAYDVLDMTHGRYVDGVSQQHMKPFKPIKHD